MKRVEELGISSTPWDHDWCGRVSECGSGDFVANSNNPNNARLIAAAPELYQCLREAVIEMCNLTCESSHSECAKTVKECFVAKWRAAIAKASGEEESK